jgi:hypothetical protein
VVRKFAETVGAECLASGIEYTAPAGDALDVKIEGQAVKLGIVAG